LILMTPLFVFVTCYGLFVVRPKKRSVIAIIGALVVVFSGSLNWRQAVLECIPWNVIGLFFGTLLLAEYFSDSRMPAVIAEKLVDSTGTLRSAMFAICAFSSGISMFVENVAVVLIVAPVALSLTEKLKVSPVKLLILIALSSNLQGTATLVDDPPSMILAGHLRMTFNDFFVYQGRPGIFFLVQAGAIGAAFIIAFCPRKHREAVKLVKVEKVKSYVPSVLMLVLIGCLSLSSLWDRDFKWFAGAFAMTLGCGGLIWYRFQARWGRIRKLLAMLDWDTTFYMIGVFVLVGGVSKAGWLNSLAQGLMKVIGSNSVRAYVFIVGLAVSAASFFLWMIWN